MVLIKKSILSMNHFRDVFCCVVYSNLYTTVVSHGLVYTFARVSHCVYRECKYAVLPSHIDVHFATKPHKLDKKERQRIVEEVAEINGLIGNEETLRRSEFPLPLATSLPIAALAKPEENRLQCTAC
jgi:hypothetical protein